MEKFDLTKILKVGDSVYSTIYGDGTVKSIDKGSDYPILVGFDINPYVAFTAYGLFRENYGECVLFPSKEERDWSKYMPKKSKNNLKPFERVLCRNKNTDQWVVGIFSHYLNADFMVATVGGNYYHCIPYEGNEHLVGTTYMP